MTTEFIIINSLFGLLIAIIGWFIKDALNKIREDLKELRKDSSSLKDDLGKKSITLEAILHDKQALFDKLIKLEEKVEKYDQHILDFYKNYQSPLEFLRENHLELNEIVRKHKAS